LVDVVGAQQWVGLEALAGRTASVSLVEAGEQSVVSLVPIRPLLQVLNQQPEASVSLLRQLATKSVEAQIDTAGYLASECETRLISAMVRFAQTAAATTDETGLTRLNLTHDQLASAIGTARETVSLTLTKLRQLGLLQTGRRNVKFVLSQLSEALQQRLASDSVDLATQDTGNT
jgi:CRP/FNR family transcriptional regulator